MKATNERTVARLPNDDASLQIFCAAITGIIAHYQYDGNTHNTVAEALCYVEEGLKALGLYDPRGADQAEAPK